jgi:hypothetical protein
LVSSSRKSEKFGAADSTRSSRLGAVITSHNTVILPIGIAISGVPARPIYMPARQREISKIVTSILENLKAPPLRRIRYFIAAVPARKLPQRPPSLRSRSRSMIGRRLSLDGGRVETNDIWADTPITNVGLAWLRTRLRSDIAHPFDAFLRSAV